MYIVVDTKMATVPPLMSLTDIISKICDNDTIRRVRKHLLTKKILGSQITTEPMLYYIDVKYYNLAKEIYLRSNESYITYDLYWSIIEQFERVNKIKKILH